MRLCIPSSSLTSRLLPLSTRCIRRTLIAQPGPRLVTPRPLLTDIRSTSDESRANIAYMQGMIAEMDELRTKAREGGGKEVLERWKSRGKGKMGARERCVDERSWELMGAG